jgi:YD repeat-containing protein
MAPGGMDRLEVMFEIEAYAAAARPDGFFVNYDYDAANRLIRVRENGATTGTGVLASYAYGPLDERASLTRGNGTAATYTYDPIARLTGLTQGAAAGSPASIQTLSYSPASQLVALSQQTAAYVWTGQPAAASTATVADGLNRGQTISSLIGGRRRVRR